MLKHKIAVAVLVVAVVLGALSVGLVHTFQAATNMPVPAYRTDPVIPPILPPPI